MIVSGLLAHLQSNGWQRIVDNESSLLDLVFQQGIRFLLFRKVVLVHLAAVDVQPRKAAEPDSKQAYGSIFNIWPGGPSLRSQINRSSFFKGNYFLLVLLP